MRLTRRGRAIAGVVTIAFLLGVTFGARSLNAVVIPGLVVLAAGYLQLRSLDAPRLHRDGPPNGFVGERHAVTLRFRDGGRGEIDRPFVAQLREELSAGLEAETDSFPAAVGAGSVDYELRYTGRGRQTIGPLRLIATDVFGVLETQFICRTKTRCVVYPAYRPIRAWVRRDVFGGDSIAESRQRDEFDRLREYDRGDSLRDIHWPTTAKRDELVVKAFAAETDRSEVTIAGGGVSGSGDRLATAVTSVAIDLLDAGAPIEVVLPNGRVGVDRGRRRLPELLELLATVRASPCRELDADVVVQTKRTGTVVRVGDREIDFEELTLRGSDRPIGPDGRHRPIGPDGRHRSAGPDGRHRSAERIPVTSGGGT